MIGNKVVVEWQLLLLPFVSLFAQQMMSVISWVVFFRHVINDRTEGEEKGKLPTTQHFSE